MVFVYRLVGFICVVAAGFFVVLAQELVNYAYVDWVGLCFYVAIAILLAALSWLCFSIANYKHN